jgi:hypothetical protein
MEKRIADPPPLLQGACKLVASFTEGSRQSYHSKAYKKSDGYQDKLLTGLHRLSENYWLYYVLQCIQRKSKRTGMIILYRNAYPFCMTGSK